MIHPSRPYRSVSRIRALMTLVNLGGMRSRGRIQHDYTIYGNEYHNTRAIRRVRREVKLMSGEGALIRDTGNNPENITPFYA